MSDVYRILVGISRRDEMAWAATAGPWGRDWSSAQQINLRSWDDAKHIAANDPAHVFAVLATARKELADAVAQQERHETGRDGERWWCTCTAGQPTTVSRCPDAEQADRTLARLAMLYGATP